MTDIMKLAEAYAWHSVHGAATTGESVIGARDALQAAIEALQCENELLKRQLDAAKDVFRQDQKCILKAVADRDALQAENERLKRSIRIEEEARDKVEVERDALADKLDELAKQEPVKFLADATRFKTTMLANGRVLINDLPRELAGRWVAFVAAENDCHMKLAAPKALEPLRSALNAMLTQFGMDEDEFNKATFDKARRALADTNTAEPLKEERINELALVRLVEAELKKGSV